MSQLVVPVNAPSSRLSANISNSATSIPVADTTDFTSTGLLSIGGLEVVTYTGRSLNSFTGVTRGTNDTSARPFQIGVTVSQIDAMATEVEVESRNLTIQYQEDGVDVSSKGGIDYINFTGTSVTVTSPSAGNLEVHVTSQLETVTSDPVSPAVGQMWLRTDL